MKRRIAYLALGAALMSAGGVLMAERFTGHADPMDRYVATPAWAANGCDQSWDDNRYLGLSQAALRRELGEAEMDYRFELGTGVTEMSVTLLNRYSIDEEPDREILQQSWTHGGCHLTIWSSAEEGEMRSIDRLRHPDGVEF